MPIRRVNGTGSGWLTRRRAVWALVALVPSLWVFMRLAGGVRRPEPNEAARRMAALVAAVGSRRVVEPRLSGGFAYGAIPSAARSPSPRAEETTPDVRIAIAEIEKLELRERSPEALAMLGAAYLSIGDATRAVPPLEEAVAIPLPAARARSDLAAAYLVRALVADNAQDLPKALAAADLAAKGDPGLAEAQFNRALALERLHLIVESRQAWLDYLRADAASAWAAEARAHLLAASASPTPAADEERRSVALAAESEDPALIATTVARMTQGARTWVEDRLLVDWPGAVAAGDVEGAAAIVVSARHIADGVAAATGDPYLADAVQAVRDAPRAETAALARAHASFRAAMSRYEDNDFVESGRAFSAIRLPLERAGSPLALAARLQVAISAYFAGEIDESGRELDRLIRMAPLRRYARLLGLMHRMRGLIDSVQARFGDALEHNMRALELFRSAADPENIAAIESSIAETLEFLGEPRTAWMHRTRALDGLTNVRSLRRRHTMLISSVLSCLRQGSPEAAAYFQSAVLDNARRWNRPEALAEAHVRQAELHGQTQDFAAVASDLAEVKRWTALVPPGPLTRQIEARAALASASFANRSTMTADEPALTEALAFLRGSGLNWPLAKAYLARGKAYAARGRPDLAERDYLDGIVEFEKQRSSLAAEALRVSYFDQPWDLFSEMVRLQATARRRPDLALNFAERGRARTLLESIASSDAAKPLEVAAIQSRLTSGVAVIYYAVLDYDVLVWRLTQTRLESFEATVAEADLRRLINRFRSELVDRSPRSAETGAQIYDILVRPALRGLPDETTLVFVPDGVLNALPFAALTDRGTGRYLMQDRSIAVAPSASVFLQAGARRDRRADGEQSALVMGNPLTGSSGAGALTDLPDAAHEASEIASLYRPGHAITGRDATKRRFLDDFDRHDVVHFAGHAVSNTDFPALSRLVFAGTQKDQPDYLFAHQIAGRHFRRTRVLVLAACQTSSGQIRRGEGVLSLARPFLAAGVPTVVASLWDADDRASRSLLVDFHAALRAGLPPARALRSAQQAALASPDPMRRLPVQWAGFVVIGSVGDPAPADMVSRRPLN